jgi:hypothetical protein
LQGKPSDALYAAKHLFAGLQTRSDAEVAGSNPARPTFAQLRGRVIAYTRLGYVAISAVPRVVSRDRRGRSCAGGGFQGARCPRLAKELGLAAP